MTTVGVHLMSPLGLRFCLFYILYLDTGEATVMQTLKFMITKRKENAGTRDNETRSS